MFKVEERFWKWVEKHMLIFALAAVTLISLCIRISLRDFISGDSAACLLPWYDIIKKNGGIRGLNEQVGNYNMLYQFLIAVMTYIPIKPLYAYKILSGIFDYFLAAVVAVMVYGGTKDHREWNAVLAYSIVVCSPLVFLNSFAWAQCDAIYSFFAVAALIAFFSERYGWTFTLYGIAFAFKLQAVFLLPFFLFIYFAKKKFSSLYFVLIPVMMCVSGIPCLIMGRSVVDIFNVYLKQTGEYEKMTMNYPSFWVIFNDALLTDSYEPMKHTAMALTVVILGMFMVCWIVKKIRLNTENMMYMAFILTYTCVLFLPSMHERYGFLYEIFAIVIVFLYRKTIPLLISLGSISMVTYGYYLQYRSMNMNILSAANLITYVLYVMLLMKKMLKDEENKDSYDK